MSSNLDNLKAEYQELSDNELETVVGGTGNKGRQGSQTTASATATNTVVVQVQGGRDGGRNGGGGRKGGGQNVGGF